MAAAQKLLDLSRSFLAGRKQGSLAGFLNDLDWEMPHRHLVPAGLPCLQHLPRCAQLAPAAASDLAEGLARLAPMLRWGQTYTPADFGQRFIDNYGWMELFGLRGHFANDRIAAGFLVLGPDVHYPDHHHAAEEIYIPLTGGAWWKMGEGAFRIRPAGEVIHHPPNVSHAMKTGAAPLLALYLWRGGPLDQRSTVTGMR
jgi:mannose-6-phosphate isomerase-like protein (cupin superfamily)